MPATGRADDRGVGPERTAEHTAHAGGMPSARPFHRRRAPVPLIADVVRDRYIQGLGIVIRIVIQMPSGGGIVIDAGSRSAWRERAEHGCTKNNRTHDAMDRSFHDSLLC